MLVAWRTGEPADSSVDHWTDLGLVIRDSDPGRVTAHALLVTDLLPGTLYHYRILSDGEVLAEGKTFRTSPAFLDPYRFIAFGDSGLGTQPQFDVAAQIALSAPDFGIHIGDLAYPTVTPAELDVKYFQVYRETIARACFYTALGNKDVEVDNGAVVLDSFYLPENSTGPERYYSFVYGNALFIALDTNGDLSESSPQRAWLEEELSKADRTWKIVFFHHAIYSSSPADAVTLANRASLGRLFDRYGVDLVFQGHNHYYERTYPLNDELPVSSSQDPNYLDPEGTIYLVTGGGGGTLLTASPNSLSAHYASTYHHLRVDVKGHRISLAAVDLSGSVIDSLTINKSDPPPAAPAGLLAVPGDRLVDLTWDQNGEADLEGYNLYRASPPSVPYSKLNDLLLTETRFTDRGLENGTRYCYLVEAVDGSGQRGEPAAACAIAGQETPVFKRADADGNGSIDLTDPIALLAYLFLGGENPSCPDAADADDSGTLDLTDAVVSLSWQFLGGPAPPEPGPMICGPDSTPSAEFAFCDYPRPSCQ